MNDAPQTVSDNEEFFLKIWPNFPEEAHPGFLGEFMDLATRESEADLAAVCITTLIRFGAEVCEFAPGKGPHIYVGETRHSPRLNAAIVGSSGKARKGTSKHPVTRLFQRDYCSTSDLQKWRLPLPARESGGPLSTGEGLAAHGRDESDADRERRQQQNPDEPVREKGDKRLIIMDEEFASALACTRREGNTLSMAIRSFWDSGDYQPLTKNNPIVVRGAHVCILTHITMQELATALGDVQAFNGFGNRFLWICARRSKLVPIPPRMPEVELAALQRELWKLVSIAQGRGEMALTSKARELWCSIYAELSKEHSGLAGSIINRAEAQTLRLALVYALLDGQGHIDAPHLQAALALWQYAQDSALYIFGDRAADPLEQKILAVLATGSKTATELNKLLGGHTKKGALQIALQELEARRRIVLIRQKTNGRTLTILSLGVKSEISGKSLFDSTESGGSSI